MINNFGNVAAFSNESLITLIANLDENLESVKQLRLITALTYGCESKHMQEECFGFGFSYIA